MIRIHILVLTALLSFAGASFAQTGPVGPAANQNPPAQPQPAGRLTPDRVVQHLKGQGHAAEKKSLENGAVQVIASVKKDGWTFNLEIGFVPDQSAWSVACILGNAPTSQAQLTEILKLSHKFAPSSFSYRDADQKLIFEDRLCHTQLDERDFQKNLDGFLKNVRDTHPIWSGSQTVASPAPTNNPVPAIVQGLTNTTWIGNENLGNYGRLEFRFLADGKVMMIDTAGQTMGTYTQNGQALTLTFSTQNVYAVYQGAINGNTFAGTGRNQNGTTWNFSVAK